MLIDKRFTCKTMILRHTRSKLILLWDNINQERAQGRTSTMSKYSLIAKVRKLIEKTATIIEKVYLLQQI